MTARKVETVVTAHQQTEGGGFVVRRPFPTRGLQGLDPLLLLDEMGPVEYAPGEAIGAPDHPHRGFETVTYILQGEGQHADSAGHKGKIGPGDVQWMTAGDGVVHREMPSERIRNEGGRVHGFQLWVNLPRADKRIAPRYQEIQARAIPRAETEDGTAKVRVIAGRVLGVEATIETRTPITYHHWTLACGAKVNIDLPSDHRIGVYVFDGTATVAGRSIDRGQLAVLGSGDKLMLAAENPAQALVLGGRPLGEPIAWGGPFVMNTKAEVAEAYADYHAGRMGRIAAKIERQ